MSFLSKIKGLFLQPVKVAQNGDNSALKLLKKKQAKNKALKTFYSKLNIRFKAKASEDIDTLNAAVRAAENISNPSRVRLYTIYDSIRKDSHLRSQVRTAHATTQCSDFAIYIDSQKNEELTDMFKKPWFYKFRGLLLETEFWGHSLIEIDPNLDEDGQIKDVLLLPRWHVCPIRKNILINPYDSTGIDYTNEDYSMWFIEVGEADNLGLYESAAEEVIYKRYSGKDWSLFSELFGMPFLTLNTNVADEQELEERKKMLSNAGTARWAVLGEDERLQAIQSNSAGYAHNVYENRMKLCDSNLSKLINGQTGTTDEKSHVGAAGVHERVLSKFNYQRLYEQEAFINFFLLPHLIKHFDYPLEGAKFCYTDLLKKDEEGKDDSTPEQEGANSTPEEEPAKKEEDKVGTLLPLYQPYLEQEGSLKKLSMSLDDLVNKALENVYNQKVQEGGLDAETWAENVREIWEGVQEGMDSSLLSIEYGDPKYELSTRFLHNVQTFAAFKNHEEVAKLVELLTDATGAVRSFEEFRELAKPISTLYNGNYLRAEYNHAIAAAQMANTWVDFEADKEQFPYLRYAAQNDERTRRSHEQMDGITLPIEHEFWDNFTPPNGWGCRCFLQQLDSGELTPEEDLPNIEQVPSIFRHHPTRTGEVFSPAHPYFEGMEEDQVENLLRQKNLLVYNSYQEADYNKIHFDNSTGGFAVRHIDHQEQEERTTTTAIGLAIKGRAVELVKQAENAPDALVDGLLFSFEYLGKDANKEAIEGAVANASKRSKRLLVVVDELTENQQEILTKAGVEKLVQITWLSMIAGTLIDLKS